MKELTPAQKYAQKVVEAVNELIASEPQSDYQAKQKLTEILLERPKTLRSALSSYLYHSMQRANYKPIICK